MENRDHEVIDAHKNSSIYQQLRKKSTRSVDQQKKYKVLEKNDHQNFKSEIARIPDYLSKMIIKTQREIFDSCSSTLKGSKDDNIVEEFKDSYLNCLFEKSYKQIINSDDLFKIFGSPRISRTIISQQNDYFPFFAQSILDETQNLTKKINDEIRKEFKNYLQSLLQKIINRYKKDTTSLLIKIQYDYMKLGVINSFIEATNGDKENENNIIYKFSPTLLERLLIKIRNGSYKGIWNDTMLLSTAKPWYNQLAYLSSHEKLYPLFKIDETLTNCFYEIINQIFNEGITKLNNEFTTSTAKYQSIKRILQSEPRSLPYDDFLLSSKSNLLQNVVALNNQTTETKSMSTSTSQSFVQLQKLYEQEVNKNKQLINENQNLRKQLETAGNGTNQRIKQLQQQLNRQKNGNTSQNQTEHLRRQLQQTKRELQKTKQQLQIEKKNQNQQTTVCAKVINDNQRLRQKLQQVNNKQIQTQSCNASLKEKDQLILELQQKIQQIQRQRSQRQQRQKQNQRQQKPPQLPPRQSQRQLQRPSSIPAPPPPPPPMSAPGSVRASSRSISSGSQKIKTPGDRNNLLTEIRSGKTLKNVQTKPIQKKKSTSSPDSLANIISNAMINRRGSLQPNDQPSDQPKKQQDDQW